MLTVLVGGATAIVGSYVTWFFTGRREQDANLHEKLALSAIERMDRAERRIDEMEKSWRNLREEIYVHISWDDLAYRKMLETDPDYPPPPPLSI
jgi:hypothetical protein